MKKKPQPKTRYSRAYTKAVEELDKDHVNEIKVMVKKTLDGLRERQEKILALQAESDFLKADLADLKRGKLDRIKARHEKETAMAQLSPIKPTLLTTGSYVNDAATLYYGRAATRPSTGSVWIAPQTYTNAANSAIGEWLTTTHGENS